MGQRVENGASPEKMIFEENDIIGNEGSSDSEHDEGKNNDDFDVDALLNTFKNMRHSVPQAMPLLLLQLHNAQK